MQRKDAFRLPATIFFVLVCIPFALGSPWPRFRGPNGTGVVSDKNIPLQWSQQEGVIWKTAIPGQGNSSPVVWGDRLFLQSAGADGKERLLICVNVADGKIAWSQSVPGASARMHKKNTLASSTPATDGERVYALFWDGQGVTLFAYDFEGKPCWKADLGRFASQHGAGTSPMVHAGKVFVANDCDGSATLDAVDAKTGKIVWQRPRRPFRACYSTPFVLEKPGVAPELIVASTAGITGYNPDTGAENWDWRWTFAGMPLRTVGSPVHDRGLIFANSGDGSGERNTIALRVGSNGAVAELAWVKHKNLPYVPTMLASGDHLFFVNDDGFATCLVANTGETVWSERLGGKVSASPIVVDGKIVAINEDGTVYVFSAAPSFKLLAKNQIGEPVMATPAVADGRLFIRGDTHLFCIGRASEKRAAE
jgi:outer membrane protein assembly factor BamB